MKKTQEELTGSTKVEPVVLNPFLRILGYVDRVSRWVLVANMLAMTLLVIFQVLTRYLFSYSIAWADEMSRLTFVWSMFLAIPHGLKAGVHVGIDILVGKFPPFLAEATSRVMMAFCALLCLIVFYYGIRVTNEKMQELMPILNFTAAVYYIPVLISMGHSFLHLLVLMIYGAKAWEGEKT